MLTSLRQSAKRLRDRLFPERPYAPDWRVATIRRAFAGHPDPRIAEMARGDPDDNEFRRRVCLHFRNRTGPRFFVDLADLAAMARSPAVGRVGIESPHRSSIHAGKVPSYVDHDLAMACRTQWADADAGPGDDILYPVRPHRFAAAPKLALSLLRDTHGGAPLADAVQGWMQYAQERRGPMAYLSNLVVIQRVLALSWAWAFLAARPPASINDGFALEFDVLRILFADCAFLLPRLGDSYPNNHLLADVFAGWYISLLFPEFTAGAPPREHHEASLRSELERQVLEDGTGFEHSTHYHEFACEMTLAHVLLSLRNGQARPWSRERLERMLRFQLDLAGPECAPCAIGNATEDPLFPLDDGNGWSGGAFREIYRALFDATRAPAPMTDRSVERAFWLLGGKLAARTPSPAPAPTLSSYAEGGFFAISDADTDTRLVFRTGPAAGARVMAGHMHADLLSIVLSVRGRPVFVDPGTFTYRLRALDAAHGAVGWRAYFAGPQAHNGPVIGATDPLGELRDDFRPRDISLFARTTESHAGGALAWVEAELAGAGPYAGLRRGFVHVGARYGIVYDLGAGTGDALGYRFQCAPGVEPDDNVHRHGLQIGDGVLQLIWTPQLRRTAVLKGAIEPRGGWVAPRYGELVPAAQLVFERESTASREEPSAFVLQTAAGAAALQTVQAMALGDSGLALRIEAADFADYVLLRRSSNGPPLDAWGIRFDGVVLWLRLSRAGQPLEMSWISGRALQVESAGVSVESHERLDTLRSPKRREDAAGTELAKWPAGVIAVWPDGSSDTLNRREP